MFELEQLGIVHPTSLPTGVFGVGHSAISSYEFLHVIITDQPLSGQVQSTGHQVNVFLTILINVRHK